jgi:hypothetical protein
MGVPARDTIAGHLGIDPEQSLHGPIDVGERSRMVLFLPHPNSRGVVKTIHGNLRAGQFSALRDWVQVNIPRFPAQ